MKKGPHKMMLESSRYDKWERGGVGGGGSGGTWPGRERERERERDRERERQARAHQMSHAHAPEPDASALFPAPFKVTGNKDHVSQQIQIKLGDYHLAQTLLDDPSKSIGICAEPPSPAPCLPSRRENEFKKPSHAPQNGRTHHRSSLYNKVKDHRGELPGSTGPPLHRPQPHRIPNGVQHQNTIDSSQPAIESILKEMRSLPMPLSVLAQTPRKEPENKYIYNPHTNKVQEHPQQPSNDLKSPLPKPSLDNRITNSITLNSPDVVGKDLGLSESDDEVAATTRLHPIVSPMGSGDSPSSDSESSHSDSESESSSTESSSAPPPPPVDQTPTPRDWSLSNFAPPTQIPEQARDSYETGKELAHALADVKGKLSPISDLSDSEASSPSPGSRRRCSTKMKTGSSQSSDEEQPTQNAPSPRVSLPAKRGRPPKTRSSDRPAKKKRGRPPKMRPPSPSPPPSPAPIDSDGEKEPVLAPPHQDTKSHIFRRVFTPRKGDEGGGKGGKGGKGKGGKGKGQVTIIEVTPESNENDDHRHRDRSDERRKNEEAIQARLSPQPEENQSRKRERNNRRSAERQEKLSYDRIHDLPTERNNDRLNNERSKDRISNERLSNDRLLNERLLNDRLQSDRLTSDRLPTDRIPNDRLPDDKLSIERLPDDKLSERLSDRNLERRSADRNRTESGRYIKAEADVGLIKSERGSERLSETFSNAPHRGRPPRLPVSIPLARLKVDTLRVVRGSRRPPASVPRPAASVEVAATNHERPVAGQTPVHLYSDRGSNDILSDDGRDHTHYLREAKLLKEEAQGEQQPLQRVMLYLESVLCFVRTGEVLEQEMDTKRAFDIYRQTIEYIKSIHSMPQRLRASPNATFSKLDILSLRVQSLLYLRMFKMYHREVKEYHKIVQEYQQKPANAESVSPHTPSPAGSLTSVGSASSGYCSLVHSVPASAHNALLQLTKYYTFLYVAHDLWEHSERLCWQRPNQDLFIAVDRKCGPLTLFSTFRDLVSYVRYAISLLKQSPRE